MRFTRPVIIGLAALTIAVQVSWPSPETASAVAGGAATWSVAPSTRTAVCSLLDADAAQAGITGQDGGMTATVRDVTYWLFGDTGLDLNGDGTRDTLIPNSIATSAATAPDPNPGNCVSRTYKKTNGVAAPLLPVAGGSSENAVWPTTEVGAWEDRVHFFYQSMEVRSPSDFTIRFVGLGSFATSGPDALNGHRLGGDPGSSFWPNGANGEPDYHVTSVQAVRGDDTRIYLILGIGGGAPTNGDPNSTHTDVKLARVWPEGIEDRNQYEYWDADTHSFVVDFAAADALFGEDNAIAPGQVSYNPFLTKWTMVYNGGTGPDTATNPRHFGTNVSIRTADQLSGPWSSPSILFDCRTRYPSGPISTFCYAATEHRELQANGGQTIYVTVANEFGGRLYLHQVTLARPVHQHSVDGQHTYCIDCSGQPPNSDEGIVFFAADVPSAGLVEIHEYRSPTGDIVYASTDDSPPEYNDQGVVFYARTRADYSTGDEPVYRWDALDGANHLYAQFAPSDGYARRDVAFFAACPSDSDFDGVNDCHKSMEAVDGSSYDGDRDGCRGAKEPSLIPAIDPLNPWDFYDVPVPALIAIPPSDAVGKHKDGAVGAVDSQAVYAYFKAGAKLGSTQYDQDLNQNGIADGVEYDRRVLGPAKSGPPDGVVGAADAQLAWAQFVKAYTCNNP